MWDLQILSGKHRGKLLSCSERGKNWIINNCVGYFEISERAWFTFNMEYYAEICNDLKATDLKIKGL